MTALKQMGENDLKELGIPMVIHFLFLFCSVMLVCSHMGPGEVFTENLLH